MALENYIAWEFSCAKCCFKKKKLRPVDCCKNAFSIKLEIIRIKSSVKITY